MSRRNLFMAERIAASPVRSPFTFVIAGDSGAWPDPTADAIFTQLLKQVARLRPPPLFFANLGDFAGPGTRERHERYLRLMEELPVPDVCVVGNHDLDDGRALETWTQIHGPRNFQFAYGSTRFIAIDAAPGEAGRTTIETSGGTRGPDDEALAFLADALENAPEPHRVVLMHMPPRFGGRFAPHPEWGFDIGERRFLNLVREHRVGLVCCAHALLFDQHVHDGTLFVVSGGGGTGICSHLRGICASGEGRPEDR
jgi:calcineurin-like phosphoesterase family protein